MDTIGFVVLMTATAEEGSDWSVRPSHQQQQEDNPVEEVDMTSLTSSSPSSGLDGSTVTTEDTFTKLEESEQPKPKIHHPPDSPTCSATSSGTTTSSSFDGRCASVDDDHYFVLQERLGRVIPTSDGEEEKEEEESDDDHHMEGSDNNDDGSFDDTSDDEGCDVDNGGHTPDAVTTTTTSTTTQKRHHRRVRRPSDVRKFSSQQEQQHQGQGVTDLHQIQIVLDALEQLNRLASMDSAEYQQRLLDNSLPDIQDGVSSWNKATTIVSSSSSLGSTTTSSARRRDRIDQRLSTPLIQLSMSLHRLHSAIANLTHEVDGHSDEMVSLQTKLCTSQERTRVLEGAIKKLHKRNIKLKRTSELNRQVATDLTHQVHEHAQQLEDQGFQLMASKVQHHEIRLQLAQQQQQQQLLLQQQQQQSTGVSVNGRDRTDSTFSELILEDDDEDYTSAGYDTTTKDTDCTISVDGQSADATTTTVSVASARTKQQQQQQQRHNHHVSMFEDIPPSLRISMHGSSITSFCDDGGCAGGASSSRQRTWSGFSTTSNSSSTAEDVVVSASSLSTGRRHDIPVLGIGTNPKTSTIKNQDEAHADEIKESTQSKQPIHSSSSSSNGGNGIKAGPSQLIHQHVKNPFAMFVGARTEQQSYTVKIISQCTVQFVALPSGSLAPPGNGDDGDKSIVTSGKTDDVTTSDNAIKDSNNHVSDSSLSSQLEKSDGIVSVAESNENSIKNISNNNNNNPDSSSLDTTTVTNTLDVVATTDTTKTVATTATAKKQSYVFALCGFKGFDAGVNVKPSLGSRLVAINGIDVNPHLTLDELYDELKLMQGSNSVGGDSSGTRSGSNNACFEKFLTLTFRIESWNHEQNEVLNEAINMQQKGMNVKHAAKQKETGINVPLSRSIRSNDTVEGQAKDNVADKSRCEHDKLLHHTTGHLRSSTDSVGKAFNGIGNFFHNLHYQHDKSSTTKRAVANNVTKKSPLEQGPPEGKGETKCQASVQESTNLQVGTTNTSKDLERLGTVDSAAVPSQGGGSLEEKASRKEIGEEVVTATSCGSNKSEKKTNSKGEGIANPIDNVLAFFANAIQ